MAWLLVADDDDDLRGQLADALAERGYEVRTASDGAEALDLLAAPGDKPAAVLLDLLMPRVNGREALERMRHTARGADVPVIVLSGIVPDEGDLAGLDVAAVFLKPVSMHALVEAIERSRTR
jgi:DNA-binding response OmpR family regulator